jgi:quinol monooxygenase YgiN
MYCVVYEFKVKPGMNAAFEKSWGEFTEAIYRVCGSLGSRLHKTEDSLVYVAYAQWPSKAILEADVAVSAWAPNELEARTAMKDSLAEVKVVYRLEMADDHLRTVSHKRSDVGYGKADRGLLGSTFTTTNRSSNLRALQLLGHLRAECLRAL